MKTRRPHRRFLLPACLLTVLAVGAGLSWLSYQYSVRMLEHHAEVAFVAHVEEQIQPVISNLANTVVMLDGLARLFHTTETLKKTDFTHYADQALKINSGVLSFEWIPRVAASGKKEFEARLTADLPGFRIYPWTEAISHTRRTQPNEYFPVLYQRRIDKASVVTGLDMASLPGIRNAMHNARDKGGVAMSSIVGVVSDADGTVEKGIIMLMAIQVHGQPTDTVEQRRQHLAGYVAAVITLDSLIGAATQQLEQRHIRLDIRDITDLNLPTEIDPGDEASFRNNPFFARAKAEELSLSRDLLVADRKWRVTASANAANFNQLHAQRYPWLILAGGLLISGLLALITLLLVRNSANTDTRYRSLFEQATDGIFLVDGDRILDVNPEGLAMLGRQRDQVVGHSIANITAASHHKRLDDAITSIMHGNAYREEWKLIDANNKMLFVEISARALNDSQFLAVVHNISHRKNEEEATLRQQKELQQILDNMLDSVITIDEHGLIQTVNRATSTLFGFSPEQMLGRNVSALMPEPQHSEHDSYLASYVRTGRRRIIGIGRDVRGKHRDGHVFPMRLSVSELPAHADGRRRFIGTCHDLTRERLQEEQLQRTQRMDALGKLTGGLAHDFNNIMGVILGYAEMLQPLTGEQGKAAGYLNEIIKTGEKARRLTARLLSFSSRKPTSPRICLLQNTVSGESLFLEKPLKGKAKLRIDLAADLWPVMVEESDLENSLLNLCINAAHAITDPSNGKVVIKGINLSLNESEATLMQLPAGDYVRLSVTDNGCGMDADTRQRVFEPFFTTKGEMGTGLGLPQVYGFMQRSGGTVKLYSEPGQGTEFSLYFPRAAGDASSPPGAAPQQLKENTLAAGTRNILVVDDEETLLHMTSEMLGSGGYNVHTASNASQALLALETQPIDLMLTDIVMPELDGTELANLVMQLHPQVKIQLMSGFSDDRHAGNVSAEIYDRRLAKPFTRQQLFDRIEQLLGDNG